MRSMLGGVRWMRKMLGTTERSRAKDAARLSMVSRSFEAISMGSMSSENRDMARFVTFSTPFSNLSRNPMDSTSPKYGVAAPGMEPGDGTVPPRYGPARTCVQVDTVPIVTVAKPSQGRRPRLCEVIVS